MASYYELVELLDKEARTQLGEYLIVPKDRFKNLTDLFEQQADLINKQADEIKIQANTILKLQRELMDN